MVESRGIGGDGVRKVGYRRRVSESNPVIAERLIGALGACACDNGGSGASADMR